MKKIAGTVGAAFLIVTTATCGDLNVTDLNNPSVEGITSNPTRASIAAATQGLMRGTRDNVAAMVQWMGAFGREGYPMSQTGASLSGSVQNPLSGANFPGTTLWDQPYRNIRNANLLIDAVDRATELNDAEKQGVLGFAKTIQAYDFLNVILTRDRFGAPIDVGGDPTGDPAPFVTKDAVYQHVVDLLEQAKTHLNAAGTAFPFEVHSGLSDFSTPSTFLLLNRALRARVAVYMDDWNIALTALSESFLDLGRPLNYGAWHVFTTNSGDATNPLNRPDFLYAHPRIRNNAQLRQDGSIDLRAQQKVTTVPSLTVLGITSDVQFTLYSTPTAPVPWVKNEELILLRAEANLGLGNYDLARDDINFIRVNSGGLEPITTSDPAELLDELLYNKRYSLVWEYGHVWIDLRHYGRLDELPVTAADPIIVDAMPIPSNECFSRSPEPTGCGELVGNSGI
ncbi:MAG TPA: RagB/SusD family nutrient uptake outer membrane protein [Candidatus Krumholzibacteria bacterium]|nr:RagB/SusD family nutrient uptake outer membrane protein [Candidatus Krumholzibacteria bacterium]